MTTLTQATQIVNFTFEQSPIRIIDQNGEFWFVANDVCGILEVQNTTQALQSLDDDEKSKLDTTSSPMFNIGLDHRAREINIINESGLYALILRSRKAMQKGTVQHKFRKWVTSEVLPSIRKTGQYRHTVSEDQAHAISKAIKIKCGHQRTHYQTIYHALYDAFGVTSYKELLASDFDAAMAFIAEFDLPTHEQKAGNEVILKNARRMWKWWAKEGISLSACALYGVKHDDSKIVEPVESVWLEAIEIIPCTDVAIQSLEDAPHVEAE
ncbi:BRO family protein [Moraxella bovis]|uniref:Uncharacterized phage-encoded protein n=1 Tax=Moraxella bovis TaxID=476 RepID=A0A378PZH7_MORBO|nr:BRO family protein [Moraxella bovis]STY93815.1 Uncharacterized phage-encoded protein [Moraxella bovis]